jgi:SAM-dependent methyltransferase
MNKNNIYNDGSYIDQNPTLHDEDSFFKFSNIKYQIEKSNFLRTRKKITILDIGGGNGKVGRLFCDYLFEKKIDFQFDVIDLSEEMIKLQKLNNKYLNNSYLGNIENINENYDIILMIDVIEHVEDYHSFTEKLNSISEFIIFNIPIEKNLFDRLRNIYFNNEYYKEQNKTLGHVNFYSFTTCKLYLKKYFTIINLNFIPYAKHILASDFEGYILQKKSKVRLFELKLSHILYNYFPFIAKYVVQGSCYSIVKTKL